MGTVRWSGLKEAAAFTLAAKQHGVVSRAQLVKLGASPDTIRRRLGAKLWKRRHPGVYILTRPPRSLWHQELMAACLWQGPTAVVSHRAAAALWELDGVDGERVELTVRKPTSGRRAVGVVIHRSDLEPRGSVDTVDGIPVTQVWRTLLDLAAVSADDTVDAAIDCAFRTHRTGPKQLAERLRNVAGRGRRGLRRLRMLALSNRDKPRDSELERQFYRNVVEPFGLPKPVHNHKVFVNGKVAAKIDVAFPAYGVAVDLHGKRYHRSTDKVIADSRRQNLLVRAGLRPYVFWWEDVMRRPQMVADEIRGAIEAALVQTPRVR